MSKYVLSLSSEQSHVFTGIPLLLIMIRPFNHWLDAGKLPSWLQIQSIT